MKSIYDSLGFEQYRGESWRWVLGSRAAWSRTLCAAQLKGHLQLSFACKASSGNEAVADLERILPAASVSCHGLILLLCRWSLFTCARRGGVACEENRQATVFLLRALCMAACKGVRGSSGLTLSSTSLAHGRIVGHDRLS